MPPSSTIYQHESRYIISLSLSLSIYIYISYFILPWRCLAESCLLDVMGLMGYLCYRWIRNWYIRRSQVENDWDWTLVVLETLQAFQSQQFETGFEVVPEAELPDANVKQDVPVSVSWQNDAKYVFYHPRINHSNHNANFGNQKKQLADLASKARSSKTRKRPLPKSEDSLPQNVSWHLVTIKCIVKIWLSHVSNCICGVTFARIYVIYVLLLATALKKA